MDKKEKLISIVLALRNEEKYIEKCLKSCFNQTLDKALFEIIVVDGLSDDNTLGEVNKFRETHPGLSIIILENKNRLQASGWNIGFKYSRAEYLLMLGGHTVIEPDFLEMNIRMHRKHDVPCTGGLVAALGEDDKSQAIGLAFNNTLGAGNAKYWYGRKEALVETVAFGMYKRRVIEEVGYLNEKIVRGQDWELNYRIVQRFGLLLFSPLIKSYYFARSDYSKLWKRQYEAGAWKLYIIKEHPQSIMLRHLIPPALVAFILTSLTVFFTNPVNVFWLVPSIIYLLIIFFYAQRSTWKKKSVLLLKVAKAFVIIHFGYGLGFFAGIYRLLFNKHES